MSNRSSSVFSPVGSWQRDFPGSSVRKRAAPLNGWWPTPVKGVVFAPRASHGGWPTAQQPTWWKTFYHSLHIDRGPCLFLTFSCEFDNPAWQRLRARCLGLRRPLVGAVTLCQRYGSLLQFSPHFHSWLPDGVFAEDDAGQLQFHRLPTPADDDIHRLLWRMAHRVEVLLNKPEADIIVTACRCICPLVPKFYRARWMMGLQTG